MALLAHDRYFLIVFMSLCIGLNLNVIHAQSETNREYQIKAAFLYNFIQFVKWPNARFSNPDGAFQIGILGSDPFGATLDDTFKGEQVNGHPFAIKRSVHVQDLEDCQLIFISRSEGNIDAIVAQLKSKAILTVSDSEGFAEKGVDINFFLAGGKVRFEINQQSTEKCGLKMSSQLMSLGKIVKS